MKKLDKVLNFIFSIPSWIIKIILSKVVFVVFMLFSMTLLLLTIGISLFDPQNDTTFLTNLGFAILAALAAINFSWARAIDQNDKEFVNGIIHSGELSLLSGILFLFASGFKYAFLFFLNPVSPNGKLTQIVVWLYGILFILALAVFWGAIVNIGAILRTRLNRRTDFMDKIRERWNA